MKHFLNLPYMRLAFEIILILAIAVAALSYFDATKAAPAQAPDSQYWYVCNAPNHVGLFSNRVHIFCTSTTPIGGAPALSSSILWFAYPTSPDSTAVARYMSMMQASVISGRTVWVQVDPTDTSGTSFGCGSPDCRRLYGLEMR